MKQLLILTLLLIIALGSFAQNDNDKKFNYYVDFDAIAQKCNEPNSKYNFKELKARFLAKDESLTNYDILALMVGVTQQEYYKPLSSTSLALSALDLMSKGNYQESLDKCNEILEIAPLNFSAMSMKEFLHHAITGDSLKIYDFQIEKMMTAMEVSGDATRDNPSFVLYTEDANTYFYLNKIRVESYANRTDAYGLILDVYNVYHHGGGGEAVHIHRRHIQESKEVMQELNKIEQQMRLEQGK